ncbi:hypothetical protein [Streptococcus uberis]|uniref:hypothetical protein n=1 Tax=Streptococcus uberis TaxID=1349 RepID=UPI003D7746E8
MEETKIADRILKNYHKFEQLSELSERPFSLHGRKLIKEIDKVIDLMPEQAKMILCNQYKAKKPIKKSRKQFCLDHNISIDEYIKLRENALVEFIKLYRGGIMINHK